MEEMKLLENVDKITNKIMNGRNDKNNTTRLITMEVKVKLVTGERSKT